MRHTAVISTANNYIRVHGYHQEFVERVIMPFCRMNLYKTGRVPIPGTRETKYVTTHVFARFNFDKTEFRICRELFDSFIDYADTHGYHKKRIKVISEAELSGVNVSFQFQDGWGSPRPHQVDWLEYQMGEGALKINNMTPGGGKTFCALYQMVKMGVRTLITIQPRYIPVWIKALGDIVQLGPRDVILCEGDLSQIVENIENGTINPKVVILPMTRIEQHLKKEKEDESYPDLDNIFRRMGCGFRIQDEAHEAIHQIYLSMMYGNFPKTLVLSGTLQADDPFTNKIYRWLFPKKHYLKATEHKQYLDIVAYQYQIDMRKYRINTMSFGSYSDVTFEKSIIRNGKLMKFYFELVKKAFDEFYLPRRREGGKCLLFFSKVDMCERICSMLKHCYPDMDIITYTGENSKKERKDEYRKHEVVISTPGSCGTGKDIPGLINVFCWHTVSSMQRNDQILMRLRDISNLWTDIDPLFLYGVCLDIPKHKEYHRKRYSLFEPKAKRQRLINSDMILM
ncbi:putative terminase [Erwinia phage vB_EamM_RisingSun]|uniref:Putative terminase n=1 Tax=Erwinia phage vB_EamM_RisingSun TaxID=2026080 RepID=A0A223LI28_9CAUD|nr:DNA helicase [Erwinia phage vB_EamM_RisingSun]ASU03625.1 putative terminase [Erwinia phage vB_EamM_RisingSun]